MPPPYKTSTEEGISIKLTSVHHIAVINSNYERPAKIDRVLMLELKAE